MNFMKISLTIRGEALDSEKRKYIKISSRRYQIRFRTINVVFTNIPRLVVHFSARIIYVYTEKSNKTRAEGDGKDR